MRHARHYAFGGNMHRRSDEAQRAFDQLSQSAQEIIDLAMDRVFDVMDKIPDRVAFTMDDLRGYANAFAQRAREGCQQQTSDWRDDDDPEDALR